MGRSMPIPNIHKILNLVVNHGFYQLWMQSLIMPIFKNGDKRIPSNYMTIMISQILAKTYGIILENKLNLWLESQGKRTKGKDSFRRHVLTIVHLATLRIIAIVKLIYFFVLWTLERLSTVFLEVIFRRDLKRSWFHPN